MKYDDAYARFDDYFGSEPDRILKDYSGRIDRSRPVLDIGVGQGRHAFFLARKGIRIDAIDPSEVSIRMVSAIARREKLSIRTYRCGFEEFFPETDLYSGILIFGLIQTLRRESIGILVEKVKLWTCEGSLIFVTGFTTADPSFARYRREGMTIGKNSFVGKEGDVNTYLEPGEILQLFHEFEAIHHWEGMGRRHRHGNGAPERHARFEAVLKR